MGEDGVEGEGDRGDIQKKITRWASGAGVMEELFPGRRLPVETSKVAGGLVVVASLLTKIPNLGGASPLTSALHGCIAVSSFC